MGRTLYFNVERKIDGSWKDQGQEFDLNDQGRCTPFQNYFVKNSPHREDPVDLSLEVKTYHEQFCGTDMGIEVGPALRDLTLEELLIFDWKNPKQYL